MAEERRFTPDHLWARREAGGEAVLGIASFGQDELGDIVFVELPAAGDRVVRGDLMGSVESVKTVYELVAPLTGEVLAQNDEVLDHPELINEDPEGRAWLIRLRLEEPGEFEQLLDEEAYRASLPED